MANDQSLASRLSRISTYWELLDEAHRSTDSAVTARRELIKRYQGAAYRYLCGAVRDTDRADELFQEFALRVMQGRFQGADAAKGRFRDYLKSCLYRLVIDHFRQRRRRLPTVEVSQFAEASWEGRPELSDQCFLAAWREELLAAAWQALERYENDTEKPYFSLLRFRTDHADLSSAESAAQWSQQLGRNPPVSAAGFRKLLQRARVQFAQLLFEEVSHSVGSEQSVDIEQELVDLDLHKYCRKLL